MGISSEVKDDIFVRVIAPDIFQSDDDDDEKDSGCDEDETTIETQFFFSLDKAIGQDEESLLTKFNKNYITIEHMTSTSRELVGLQVWRGAFLLADYILHNQSYFKHKNVLELASGVGLTAIVASLISKSVVATDVDRENILSLLESNIRKNTTTGNVTVAELDFFWDKYPEDLATKISDCDIVLAADVVYVEAITTNFVKTVKNILSYGEKSKTVLIALEKRREVTKDGDIVAPYYAHFERCLLELKGEVIGDKSLEMQELKIDFPQYFEYTRVPELTLWRIRQI